MIIILINTRIVYPKAEPVRVEDGYYYLPNGIVDQTQEIEPSARQALIYRTIPDDEESESIILDRYEFRIEKKSSKTSWRCTRNSCKARFVTFDDIVEIQKSIRHNHEPTFNGSLDECSVEIIEIRLDPLVKAAQSKPNLMKNGEESEGSTEKTKKVDQPLKVEPGSKKRDPEIVVMGVDSLRDSRFALRRREAALRAKYAEYKMEKRASLRRSESSPQLKENAGASSRETGKQLLRRVSSGYMTGRIMKRKNYG